MSTTERQDGTAATISPDFLDQAPPVDLDADGDGILDVGRKRLEFQRITCKELDSTTYELEYLINKTLVAGQPCIFAAAKKMMKTSMVIDMGLSLAMAGHFLGTMKVNRACRVGIMSGESGMAVIQETARRICAAAGYNLGDVSNLVFSASIPQLDNPAHLLALRRFILDDEIEVLIIDPTYLAMRGADAGNLFIQGEMLRTVNEVCTSMGVTLILVHHCRKGGKVDPFEPAELEDIAWAGFQEFCRQWLLISRREKYEPGTGEHRLWLNVGGSAGHSALWAVNINEGVQPDRYWQVETCHASEAREDSDRRRRDAKEEAKQKHTDEQLERDRERICRAMVKYPEGETKTVIRQHAGRSSERFNVALASLLDDDSVVRCEVEEPGRKTPFEGYKLADGNTPLVVCEHTP